VISPVFRVRVWLSHERPEEAERELTRLAEAPPHKIPGFATRDWDFLSLDTANLFMVCAETIPGVLKVDPPTRGY
jgi:hypothetical protein